MEENNSIKADTYTSLNPDPTKGLGPILTKSRTASKSRQPFDRRQLGQKITQEQLLAGAGYTLPKQQSDALPLFGSKDLEVLSSAASYNQAEDIWAANQSVGTKWANGIGKFLVNTGATFVDNVVGTVYGIGLGIGEWIFGNNENLKAWERWQHGYINNHVTSLMQDWRDWSQEKMQNYQTKEEKNADWWDRFWTANFLTDLILTNAGFTVGTLLSMWAQGAAGGFISRKILPNSIRYGVKTDKKFLNAVSQRAANALQGTNNAVDNVSGIRKLLLGQKYLGKRQSLYSAMAEARMEGYTNAKDWRDRWNINADLERSKRLDDAREAFRQLHLYDPEYFTFYKDDYGRLYPEPTEKALNEFNEIIKSIEHQRVQAARKIDLNATAMGAEIARAETIFLTVDNMLNLARVTNSYRKGVTDVGKLVKGSEKSLKFIKKEVDKLVKEKGMSIADATKAVNDRLWLLPTFWTRPIGGLTRGILQGPVVEANEEMFLAFITEASGLRRGALMNNFYKALVDEETPLFLADGLTFLELAWDKTYADPRRWEEGVIGAITGLLGTASIPNYLANKKAGVKSKWYDYMPWLSEVLNEWLRAKENNALLEEWEKIANAVIFLDPEKQKQLANTIRALAFSKQASISLVLQDEDSFNDNMLGSLLSLATAAAEMGIYDEFLEKVVLAFPEINTDEDARAFKDLFKDKTGKSLYDSYTTEDIKEEIEDKIDRTIKVLLAYKNARDLIVKYFNNTDLDFIGLLAFDATMLNTWKNDLYDKTHYVDEELAAIQEGKKPLKVKIQSIIESLTDQQRNEFFDGKTKEEIKEELELSPLKFIRDLAKDRGILSSLARYRDLKMNLDYVQSNIEKITKGGAIPPEGTTLDDLNRFKTYLEKQIKKLENLDFIWAKHFIGKSENPKTKKIEEYLGVESNYSKQQLFDDLAEIANISQKIADAESRIAKISNDYSEFEKIKKETNDMWVSLLISRFADNYLDNVTDVVSLKEAMDALETSEDPENFKKIIRDAIKERLSNNPKDKELWDGYLHLTRLLKLILEASTQKESDLIEEKDNAETKERKINIQDSRKRLKANVFDVYRKEWEDDLEVLNKLKRETDLVDPKSTTKYHRNLDDILEMLEEEKEKAKKDKTLSDSKRDAYVKLIDDILLAYSNNKSNMESSSETKAKPKEEKRKEEEKKPEEKPEEKKTTEEPPKKDYRTADEIALDELSEDEKKELVDSDSQKEASKLIERSATNSEKEARENGSKVIPHIENTAVEEVPTIVNGETRTTGYVEPPYSVEALNPNNNHGVRRLEETSSKKGAIFRELISPVLDSGIVGIINTANKGNTTIHLLKTDVEELAGISTGAMTTIGENNMPDLDIVFLGIETSSEALDKLMETYANRFTGNLDSVKARIITGNDGKTYLLVGMLGGMTLNEDGTYSKNNTVEKLKEDLNIKFKASGVSNGWWVSPITNRIQKVYSGRIAHNLDGPLPLLLNGKEPILAVHTGGGNFVTFGRAGNVLDAATNFTPTNGSVWYLTRGADAKLYYKLAIPQRLSYDWLGLDAEGNPLEGARINRDLPILNEIKKCLETLLNKDSALKAKLEAKYKLRKLLYFGEDKANDIHFNEDSTGYRVWITQKGTAGILASTLIETDLKGSVDDALKALALLNLRFTINLGLEGETEESKNYAENIIKSEILYTDLLDGHFNSSIELYNFKSDYSIDETPSVPEGVKLTTTIVNFVSVANTSGIRLDREELKNPENIKEGAITFYTLDNHIYKVNLVTEMVLKDGEELSKDSEEFKKLFNTALVFYTQLANNNTALFGNIVYQVVFKNNVFYVKATEKEIIGYGEQEKLEQEYNSQNTEIITVNSEELLKSLHALLELEAYKEIVTEEEEGTTFNGESIDKVLEDFEAVLENDPTLEKEDSKKLVSEVNGALLRYVEVASLVLDDYDNGNDVLILDPQDKNSIKKLTEVEEESIDLLRDIHGLISFINEAGTKDILDKLKDALTKKAIRSAFAWAVKERSGIWTDDKEKIEKLITEANNEVCGK